MIICSSSNIDLIQGVSGYGTVSDGATDWRIENTATGVFNILNSPNLLTPNVSIIDAGNIGIGTIPVSGTNKLQVQGNLNVSGGYFVAGVAFKPATAVLADTATALATSRNIAGVGFTGAAAIDIPYFNLTNKITAGNGISLTAGSASSSPSISTNLTAGNGISISAAASPVISANISAGTNITFTGTNPISISAAGGTASQWTGNVGANIYYNSGNVGIGTNNPTSIFQVGSGGRLRIGSGSSDYTMIGTSDVDSASNTRITLFGNTIAGSIDYFATSTGSHTFYTTNSVTQRMVITSGGNVGIGTNNPTQILQVGGGGRLKIANNNSDRTTIGTDDTISGNNTSISFYGKTFANYNGNIEYVTSGTGNHMFFSSGGADGIRMQINSNGNVVIGGNLNVGSLTNPSDSRIKKDIEDINDETALNKLLLIQPATYNYIDVERNKGFGKVYGFIAQQIREVIPEAVTIVDNIIPNIYRKCICEDKRIYIVLPQEVLNANIKISDYGYYTITKIESDYIEVEDYSKINKDIPDGEHFVYGYEIKDFHTLNKDYIFTLNVCATQELHRRIETQSVLLKSQDDRIKDLETKVAMLMSNT